VRGSPLFRALAAFFIIAALGWPLERLTRRSEAAPVPMIPGKSEEMVVTVKMRFTALPSRAAIWHLGKEIWTTQVKDSEIEADLKLEWPTDGVDLRFFIEWPDGNPLAGAEIQVTDPEGIEHLGSIFAAGPADQVLTFH